MRTIDLGYVDIDFKELDDIIKNQIPNGRNVHNEIIHSFDLFQLKCYRELRNSERLEKSIGTLGGGNHFIEIDKDENNNKYLVIHSGSRNLGYQVAKIYQKLAVELCKGTSLQQEQQKLVKKLKKEGKYSEIQKGIEELKNKYQNSLSQIPDDLCYLSGESKSDYLHDMELCQQFAVKNRMTMAESILNELNLNIVNEFETIHNYINFDDNILRKGAISANEGEILLIPINMRDGCILGVGKGNPDWNCSAPHGAGRVMSRSQAKKQLSLKEFRNTMSNIYTTSVSHDTLDEAPMAYKSIDSIVNNIQDTVKIIKIIEPIYNFKAKE